MQEISDIKDIKKCDCQFKKKPTSISGCDCDCVSMWKIEGIRIQRCEIENWVRVQIQEIWHQRVTNGFSDLHSQPEAGKQ